MSLNHFITPNDAAPLRQKFVGKKLHEIDPPAAILDVALIRKNCKAMLDITQKMGLSFRAHVKTHKTIELTRLQVGETGPVKLITSTVAEIEFLMPYLLECKAAGRDVNVLYGMPTPPSTLKRLAAISRKISIPGKNALTLLADSVAGIKGIDAASIPDVTFDVMVKIDTGYHRSGVQIDGSSPQTVFSTILDEIARIESGSKSCRFAGFYSHRGDSYSGSGPEDALEYLRSELVGLQDAASLSQTKGCSGSLCLTLGATPTATAIQNKFEESARVEKAARAVRALIDEIKKTHDLEFHAGVYPVLDMQQFATRASRTVQDLGLENIAIRILTEVASVYTDRPKPQVLIAAGTLAIGREPAHNYAGWGVVTPWVDPNGETGKAIADLKHRFPNKQIIPKAWNDKDRTGWLLEKISQEHGILEFHGEYAAAGEYNDDGQRVQLKTRTMQVGEKLMIWPNHACVAGSCFGYYLVVDSDQGDGEEIVDVWARTHGW